MGKVYRGVRLAPWLVLLAVSLVLGAQGRERGAAVQRSTANLKSHDEFTFTRIRYGSSLGRWGFRSSWSHDYPQADHHLSLILDDLTTVNANVEGTNVYTLDDPALFVQPLAYLSEPGFWAMTEREVPNLRSYLLKGGFLIFDDFEAEQWYNFEAQVRRALPEYRLMEVDISHPIFHSFFDLKKLDFPHPLVNVQPRYYGIFEDNDPTKRMLAIVNYNNDVAEYWEWSATGLFPVDFTNEAYKLGVNYIVYAMTH